MATHPNNKPWTALLDFAANVKTIADYSGLGEHRYSGWR